MTTQSVREEEIDFKLQEIAYFLVNRQEKFAKDTLKDLILAKHSLLLDEIIGEVEKMPVNLVDIRFNPDDKPNYAHAILKTTLLSHLEGLRGREK